MPLSIPVVYGSVRGARVGLRAARHLADRLGAAGHDTTLVDPAEVGLTLLDRMYKEYGPGEAPAPMERLAALFRGADAFVVVSAEYNHLPPPALVNLLDHFLEEFSWRPAGIVTYSTGAFGGVRAGVHLRDMLAELGTVTVPTALALPHVDRAFAEDGAATDPETTGRRVDRFCAELAWYAEALAARRAEGTPY